MPLTAKLSKGEIIPQASSCPNINQNKLSI
jgi:hypothetical protein